MAHCRTDSKTCNRSGSNLKHFKVRLLFLNAAPHNFILEFFSAFATLQPETSMHFRVVNSGPKNKYVIEK